jgi:peroxiredoxin
MNRVTQAVVLIAVLVVGFTVLALSRREHAPSSASVATPNVPSSHDQAFGLVPPKERPVAPDFTLKTVDGKTVHLADAIKSGPVMLDFWATWCGPCHDEMPHLDAIYQQYKGRGLQLYGVNAEEVPSVRAYIHDNHILFPVVMDANQQVSTDYGVNAIPVTLVIGRDGKVWAGCPGFDPSMETDLPPTLNYILSQ